MTVHDDAGWLVIEALSECGPSLVFDSQRTKEFAALGRRRRNTQPAVTAALGEVVQSLRDGAPVAGKKVMLPQGCSVNVIGTPILGPARVVYGAQVWIGNDETTAPPRRNVEAFSFDPASGITFHGPGVDRNILGITEAQPEAKVSPQIFKYYRQFPRQAELGIYVKSVDAGQVEEGHSFDPEIQLVGEDQVSRRVHVTMRATDVDTDSPMIRGLIHEISDISPPDVSAYERDLARNIAQMVAEQGIGQLDLATNLVTEWLASPPPPLDLWLQEIPEYHPEDFQRMVADQHTVVSGTSSYVESRVRVRFSSTEWIPCVLGLRASLTGEAGQGLVTVRFDDVYRSSYEETVKQEGFVHGN